MPIYHYKCGCGIDEEVILPMAERNNIRQCVCGCKMRRVLEIPALISIPLTGRDISLKTLNREDGHDFPTRRGDRPRMEQAMAKGLEQRPPVTGRGWG